VIKLSLGFVFVTLDAKKDSSLVSQYGVNAYPTVILFKSTGEEIDRIVGYVPPREFLKTVKSYLRGEGTLTDLENRLRENPSNLSLLYQVGEKYQDRSKYEEALVHYQNIMSLDPENEGGKADEVLYRTAVIRRKQNDNQKAIETFEELLRRFPESERQLEAEEYIPYIYAQMGDSAEALRLYEKILVDHPDIEKEEREWVEKQIKKLKEGGE
jgi:tetratricopeptide (TPR) repeat protein